MLALCRAYQVRTHKPKVLMSFTGICKRLLSCVFQKWLTSVQPKKAIKNGNKTIEEVFPELQYNRTGVLLRGYRSREDFTQKQLSEMTGIPQRHISELENGKRQPGKDWAKKLATALNCDYRLFL